MYKPASLQRGMKLELHKKKEKKKENYKILNRNTIKKIKKEEKERINSSAPYHCKVQRCVYKE